MAGYGETSKGDCRLAGERDFDFTLLIQHKSVGFNTNREDSKLTDDYSVTAGEARGKDLEGRSSNFDEETTVAFHINIFTRIIHFNIE